MVLTLPSENQQAMAQITSFKTREVRWFLKESLPGAARWFAKLPPTSCTRESREDIYLVLPGRTDLGIKFRENRLELKYRLGNSTAKEIVPGITGVFESWEKLSFPSTPEVAASVLPEGSSASRIPVLKRRTATLIETAGDPVTYNPLGTPVAAAIQLEYTELQVLGASWHTLGLEWPADKDFAFPARLFSDLVGCARFEVNTSMGYPEFLKRIVYSKEDF